MGFAQALNVMDSLPTNPPAQSSEPAQSTPGSGGPLRLTVHPSPGDTGSQPAKSGMGLALDIMSGDVKPPAVKQEAPRESELAKSITDIPREVYQTTADAFEGVRRSLPKSIGGERDMVSEGRIEALGNTGRGILSAASIPFAPFVGVANSLFGHAFTAADQTLREGAVARNGEDKVRRAERETGNREGGLSYDDSKERVGMALSAIAPGRGGLATVAGGRPVSMPPLPPRPNGPLGVTLSRGQETGDLAAIGREQGALRGQEGAPAQSRAQEFFRQQGEQVNSAKDRVAQSFDQFGQTIADNPQEAAQLAQSSLQRAAEQRKAGVTQAYDEAKALPGEIHAKAFEGIGQRIKGDLSLRDDPIIIDDKTTPFADRALKDIEHTIDRLIIPNRADPFGQPNPENITGVSLKGVEQVRKRLTTFRNDAYGSGNAADGRAASALVKSFDGKIDEAINGGLFKGDPRAVQAWNDARAAHADYSATFKAGKNDPVGRVVEKIIGRSRDTAAIPNDVADFLYGSSGINPNSLNVGVAKRIKTVLGDQSPEWAAVKQGIFSRLVDAGEGQTAFGPGKSAQRLNKFLNADGKEMANTLFSPAERSLIQQYADLQRTLEIPREGANWSNTAGALAPVLKRIGHGVAQTVGAILGNAIAPGHHGLGELLGAVITNKGASMFGNVTATRKIVKQMPLASEAVAKWQKAVAAHARANSPPSVKALTLATSNLARALKPLGVDLGGIAAAESERDTQPGENQQ